MVKCILCNEEALKGYKYCRRHYIQVSKEEWLDNSNPEDLGFFKWVRFFFPHYVPYATPKFHKDIILMVLSLYSPYRTNRFERQLNIKAYRGASKSTLLNMLWSEYVLCNNGSKMKVYDVFTKDIYIVDLVEKFIVIGTETGTSAEDFVLRIRNEIKINKKIKYFYNIQVTNIKDDETGQWTKRAFKFNSCYVMGVGIEQPIRGKIKEASRPTLVIIDEIYSENNTKTQQQRYNIKRWFDNAVHNSLDNQRGKIIVVGTILHEDTILVENEKSDMWLHYGIPIVNPEKFQKFIEKYLAVNYAEGIVKLPYDNIEDPIERVKKQKEYFNKIAKEENLEIAWEEKDDLYFIVLIFKNAIQKNNLKSFYQEYLHILVPSDEMRIKSEFLQTCQIQSLTNNHETFIKLPHHEDYHYANVEIGIDFGTGTNDGDDSAIVVTAALDTGELVVLKAIAGKYGERDDRNYNGDFGRVEFERNNIKRIGVMDEALRLAKFYNAKMIKVGYSGSEKSRITVLRQLAESNKMHFVTVIGRRQYGEGSKVERIYNSISSFYQSYRVFHNEGLDKLNYQLQFLGSSKEDDLADALECSFYYITVPQTKKVEKKEVPKLIKPGYKNFRPVIFYDDSWRLP